MIAQSGRSPGHEEIQWIIKLIAVFNDLTGCIALCIHDKADKFPWVRDPATKIWVADSNLRGNDVRWLDARTTQYAAKFSPMGYNYAAVAYPQAGSVDFATMSEHVVALVRKKSG